MPRGDGTGPMGYGPMTGRGAGYCAGGFRNAFSGGVPQTFYPPAGNYYGPAPYYGNPYGVNRFYGFRRGFGFGRGRGAGRWW